MESSEMKQRKQKTSQEASAERRVVNTPESRIGPSSSATPATKESSEEADTKLMERILDKGNLFASFLQVKRNKGAPGVDGMTVYELESYLKANWPRIKAELLKGTYKPLPVLRVEIPKPDGGIRPLGIPAVIDRLIQQAINQALTPLFDPSFSEFSYGFRANRNAKMAVLQARAYMLQGYSWVVDIDIANFFNTMHHDLIMARVAKKIKDKTLLGLIRKYLQSGIMINGVCNKSEEGAPQGGPLSPLLANIMLDDLDKELTARGHKFVRYADDCNTYVKSETAGRRVMESIKVFIEQKLKLKLNMEKSAVDRPWNRKLLGFTFLRDKTHKIRIAPKSLQRLKGRIRAMTMASKSESMRDRLAKLRSYLAGWIGYYALSETPSVLEDLDCWIRRRLRKCLLEQWKTPANKAKQLILLGLPEWLAVQIAGSGKGPWRLVKTGQLHRVTTKAYWNAQGLVSITERYNQLRGNL